MVKTANSTTGTNGPTKKKFSFGKIFKKKNKKKNQDKEENLKVEIVVSPVKERPVEETRDEEQQDIPHDPSAIEVISPKEGEPQDALEEEERREGEEEERRDLLEESASAADDIIADLQREEANPTPPSQYQGWMGSWLENMSNMCGPVDQGGLPTIMSGEEMDMDVGTDGGSMSVLSPANTDAGSMSVLSPTSTVQSAAPLSPKEGEMNKKKQEAETTSNNKNEAEEKKVDEAKIVLAEPPQQEQAEPSRPAPMDAPTTPKSLVVSPRVHKLEPEEDVPTTTAETPKTSETPKEESDDNTLDNTLLASPENKDDTVQEAAEPTGAKMDIFASFTACCNPVTAPSMDETEGGSILEIKAAPEDATKQEGGPKDPDGDKDDENKSVARDSQSVVAEEKKAEESSTTPLPTSPMNETSKKDAEPERISGTIHKEKKNTKMGLSLKNSTMYQGVFIAKIKAGSLFSDTDLREGMQVLEIQGKPCPKALEEAVSMLRHAIGDLEIVAQKPKCEI